MLTRSHCILSIATLLAIHFSVVGSFAQSTTPTARPHAVDITLQYATPEQGTARINSALSKYLAELMRREYGGSAIISSQPPNVSGQELSFRVYLPFTSAGIGGAPTGSVDTDEELQS